MANTVTLDSIREAAEAKYGSLDIPVDKVTVRLLNPLRLTKAARTELFEIQEELGDKESDADQEELLKRAVRLVAQTSGQADALLKEVGDDLAVLATIFERYAEGTQAGEASASRD